MAMEADSRMTIHHRLRRRDDAESIIGARRSPLQLQ
jgi:hypothetical protein